MRHTAEERRLRRDGERILRAALAAAHAGNAIRHHVRVSGRKLTVRGTSYDLGSFGRVFVIAVGKAALAMAEALEETLGKRIVSEIVVTKYGHADRALRLAMPFETGHPVPDQAGVRAGLAVENLLRELNARDLLIVAVSGGASALLPSPAPGITLAAKQKTTDLLLRAGANIYELNAVRKHLSLLKGGRLARLAYPATVIGLLLSDVVGDAPGVIGSGLTAADESTFSDALRVIKRFGLTKRTPSVVLEHLLAGVKGQREETPKPGDAVFGNVRNVVIGSNGLALEAAARQAKTLGYRTLTLASTLEGETREVAGVHAQILREVVTAGHPVPAPACLLSGGETTVTMRGEGKGGRNQEFALAAAVGISGLPRAAILSAGTDGTDGPTDAAGAMAFGSTIDRGKRLGLEARAELDSNNSYPFFEALGDLVKTGPTGTNVMDVHILLAG